MSRQRLANDLAAALLAGLALAVLFTVVVALLFWSGWVLLVLALPVAALGWHWLRRDGLVRTAHDIEEKFVETRGRLVSALELSTYQTDRAEGYSIELVDAAVADAERLLAPLPIGRL
ncbi:MAG: hypothetical protein ABIK86_07225, partial [candidate division WOR-3 bacterium]